MVDVSAIFGLIMFHIHQIIPSSHLICQGMFAWYSTPQNQVNCRNHIFSLAIRPVSMLAHCRGPSQRFWHVSLCNVVQTTGNCIHSYGFVSTTHCRLIPGLQPTPWTMTVIMMPNNTPLAANMALNLILVPTDPATPTLTLGPIAFAYWWTTHQQLKTNSGIKKSAFICK